MSERQVWKPEDPESEPFANINLPNGEMVRMTRSNSSIYTFMGRLAVYDHVYYAGETEEDRSFYVFSFVGGYRELLKHMKKNKYPAHTNMTEVSRSDIEAYERAALADLGDTIPDDWLPEA